MESSVSKPLFLPPVGTKKRVLIAGAGFGGLKLAQKLDPELFQVVLLDPNNYHQFQPLFYQVATAGLEPSSIAFPLRKIFHHRSHVHIRIGELQQVNVKEHSVLTSIGHIEYDFLVISTGVTTNFFGNKEMADHAIPMKSISEAIYLRNFFLENFERAITENDPAVLATALNVVIVGGGPTGVELAGAIAEMKKYILPKDYPELDFSLMKIYLMEGGERLLSSMSGFSSDRTYSYLKKLGVDIMLNKRVVSYNGETAVLNDGQQIPTRVLIWAAGVTGKFISGLPEGAKGPAGRIIVDAYNGIAETENIFAIGDIAYQPSDGYPKGHPQVAPVAIQQGALLARNLKSRLHSKPLTPFQYSDQGSMATVGRNLAVAELPFLKLGGFIAWLMWLFVHLMSIVGVKNRLFIFLNWMWSYFTYDQSLRLLIKAKR